MAESASHERPVLGSVDARPERISGADGGYPTSTRGSPRTRRSARLMREVRRALVVAVGGERTTGGTAAHGASVVVMPGVPVAGQSAELLGAGSRRDARSRLASTQGPRPARARPSQASGRPARAARRRRCAVPPGATSRRSGRARTHSPLRRGGPARGSRCPARTRDLEHAVVAQSPHLTADQLAEALGVVKTTMANKAGLINRTLDIGILSPT
jgi:hypothetical protein